MLSHFIAHHSHVHFMPIVHDYVIYPQPPCVVVGVIITHAAHQLRCSPLSCQSCTFMMFPHCTWDAFSGHCFHAPCTPQPFPGTTRIVTTLTMVLCPPTATGDMCCWCALSTIESALCFFSESGRVPHSIYANRQHVPTTNELHAARVLVHSINFTRLRGHDQLHVARRVLVRTIKIRCSHD